LVNRGLFEVIKIQKNGENYGIYAFY